MNLKLTALVALAPVALAATAANAADNGIVILPGASQQITLSNGVTTSAYNNPNGNTGAGTITGDQPRGAAGTLGANGSLQVTGDRSRYVIGNEFDATALFQLNQLDSLSFDYQVTNNGTPNAYNTPVVRIHVVDPGATGSTTEGTKVRSEIVWEGVYNGVTNAEGAGWSTVGADGLYFTNVRSNGATFSTRNPGYSPLGGNTGVVVMNGSQVNLTLANVRQFFSANTYVTGFSIGAGSGFGSDFVGYVDNVRFGISGSTNIVNFEASPTSAAVPEPTTWALMVLGFGLVGAAARRRRAFAAA